MPSKKQPATPHAVVDSKVKKTTDAPRPFLRFFARSLDLLLYSVFISLFFLLVSPAYALHGGFLLSMFLFLSWFLIEPLFLCTLGTTFGKWLLQVEVRDMHHNKPTYLSALRRSLGVWTVGYGIGLPPLSILTLLYSYYTLVTKGTTLWDKKEFIVRCGKLNYWRAAIAVIIFIVILGSIFSSIYISISYFSPEAVSRDIAALNAQLPLLVDKDTELTNVELKNTTIVYQYRLINTQASQLDLSVFGSAMRGLIVNQLCTSKNSLQLLKVGYLITFNYTDKDGKPVGNISLSFADCQ